MKYLNFVFIILFSLSSQAFGQLNVKSEVKEVTVFSNQAQISRVQSVRLQKGNNKVKFVGLENSILPNTIQVSGTNEITVVSTNVSMENTDINNESLQVRKLNDSIQILKKKEQLGFKKVKNLEAEKNAILYNKSANGVNSGFNLDNMLDLAEYYRNNLDKLDELVYDKNLEIAEIREQKRKIEVEMGKLGYKARTNVMNVEVISDKAQTVTMKLVYVANNIGWTPFYEIKSDGFGNTIKAVCKATIYQNSKVDWKNVAMNLSTSNPSNIGSLPVVHPWVLRFKSDNRRFKTIADAKGSYSNRAMNSSYEIAQENSKFDSKSMAGYTSATNNMISREFNVSLPYSVSGKNGKAVVELESYNLTADYLYYAAPKYNCSVFLIAQIRDWEQHNFLPGSANLFLEGTFVGTTFINPNATSDTMNLVLGTDKSIVVEREKIKDLSKNTLIGGKKKVDMGIQITIKNKKGKDINLVLEDQVPTSSDERIEINVKDISGASKENETGKLTWKTDVGAGQSKVFKIKYEVTYPKNRPLSNF